MFFHKCLKKQKDKPAAKLERERILARFLAPLAGEIVGILREHAQLSIAKIEALSGANRDTLKVRLRELVCDNYIRPNRAGAGD